MIEQVPSVGRIVHFYKNSPFKEGPWPAIVVQVHGDKCVSLHAWKRDNVQEFGSSVMLGPDDGASSYWVWPPKV